MSKWHARIAHMAMHMNMVQGPLGPPKSGTGMVATWSNTYRMSVIKFSLIWSHCC